MASEIVENDIFKRYDKLLLSGIPDEQARALILFVLDILCENMSGLRFSFKVDLSDIKRDIVNLKEDIARLEKHLK